MEASRGSAGAGRGWVSIRRHLLNIALGFLAAEIAVLARLAVGLPPDVLPFLLVVIAVCLVTVAAGLLGGFTTMIVGGLLTWYQLLDPSGSWNVKGAGGVALLGYFSVTTVILATSQLYRLSEKKRQAAALASAKREADHQRLFAREMSHRLKNAMAIVQAMASQTFAHDTPEIAKFDGRLQALADAHNLLNEHVKQPTASIDEVVETAIRPFRDRRDRFRVGGPRLPLPDQQVVSLTLALHELGTNAVKYGALGDPKGWISIEWRDVDGRLQLEWKEHDGPVVKAPSRRGFGSRLLARAAMGAKLRVERDGLGGTITARP
jgi:two-component sensor histidine kinase